MAAKNILKVQNVKQVFNTPAGTPMTVLEDINFTLCENEIVGLLGKSGSGKSTILKNEIMDFILKDIQKIPNYQSLKNEC